MRRVTVVVLGLLLMQATLAGRVAAFSYTGNCVNGTATNSKIFIDKVPNSGTYITEVYGETAITTLDPCIGAPANGQVFVLPANIEGPDDELVVQLGYAQTTGGSRYFTKTINDHSGGGAHNVNSSGTWIKVHENGAAGSVEAPQAGHRYYFWIRSVTSPVGSQLWRYEISDLTDGQKWYRDEPLTWQSPEGGFWGHGLQGWWGIEWKNREQDRIVLSSNIDDVRYKTTASSSWISRQTNSIWVQHSVDGYCIFDCSPGASYHHWTVSTSPGETGVSDNKFNFSHL
jgi:hypothetical protein